MILTITKLLVIGAAEVAALTAIFGWLAFPDAVDAVKNAGLWPIATLATIVAGFAVPIFLGHWLIEHLDL